MGHLTGLQCSRCGQHYPVGPLFEGCPACASDKPANVLPTYNYSAIQDAFQAERLTDRNPTMWRYREWLPVEDPNHIITLSEGFTPLLACPRLGEMLGLSNLYVKDESRTATWSFKDRLASAAISKGVEMGAKVITITSSGNGGAAAAAYAARAGLDCVVFTTQKFPLTMRTQMQVYGAKVIATPTMQDRWTMVKATVDKFGWWPIQNYAEPPVGANPFGIEGFKTIAYEILEQLGGKAPEFVAVPTAVGDALIGMWRGFTEWANAGLVSHRPKMIAAEVFGPLRQAIDRKLDHVEPVPTRPTVAMSAGGRTSAWQALHAIYESKGFATDASEEEILTMQKELARHEGIYAEASSVLSLVAIQKLRRVGTIGRDDVAVAVLSATGLKDPDASQSYLPQIPLIEPTLQDLERALRVTYDFHMP